MNRNKGKYENIRGVASDIITRVKEAVRHIISDSNLLQKRKFEDVKILTQLKADVPVLTVKPWVITQWICPSKAVTTKNISV